MLDEIYKERISFTLYLFPNLQMILKAVMMSPKVVRSFLPV